MTHVILAAVLALFPTGASAATPAGSLATTVCVTAAADPERGTEATLRRADSEEMPCPEYLSTVTIKRPKAPQRT